MIGRGQDCTGDELEWSFAAMEVVRERKSAESYAG